MRRIAPEIVENDVTIIGGGLAGVCAAIAAARQGAHVALVQNRPVLGGNSSSEIRVWVCGATAHGVQHFARETGIMGELFLENQYANPEGNPYYWDLVVLEAVRAEANISLFLNTDVREVDASGPEADRRIQSVTGWQMGSERLLEFKSGSFIDASGDGLIGYLAGARYRTGRESRDEFDESWAATSADTDTLGSTILFYTKRVGEPVKFIPPSFARDITKTSIPQMRDIHEGANGCDYWWIEWGGELDVVADNERIRDELQAAIYGIWDYIKNSGKFDADDMALEWIGALPGKREYRRFVGDHLLTQHDVLDQVSFEDRIGFGGWSIDLHPAGGMYATERGSRHWHPDGNYHIPLRSLYSQNVSNMWMAGRNISATHVAFGTTRVMATCAVVGEAAGTAAALGSLRGLSPRKLATEEFDLVRKALVRTDASVLGVEHSDPDDAALTASVSASSWARHVGIKDSNSVMPLSTRLGVVVPVDPALDGVEVLVDVSADAELEIEARSISQPQNYLPSDEVVAKTSARVPAGERQWVHLPLAWHPDRPENLFLVLHENPAIRVHLSKGQAPGMLTLTYSEMSPDEKYTEQWRAWKQLKDRPSACVRLANETEAFAPAKVIGGFARPWGGPQMWVSAPLAEDPEPTLGLAWEEPVAVGEFALIFDDDLDEDLINLHHHRTPHDVLPTLVRDYRIEAVDAEGECHVIADVKDNRARHRRHHVEAGARFKEATLVVTRTNGSRAAHVVAFRAWSPSGEGDSPQV